MFRSYHMNHWKLNAPSPLSAAHLLEVECSFTALGGSCTPGAAYVAREEDAS